MKKWDDMEYQIHKKPTVKAGDRVTFTKYAIFRNIPTNRMPDGITGNVKKIRFGSIVVAWNGYVTTHSYHPSFIRKVRP